MIFLFNIKKYMTCDRKDYMIKLHFIKYLMENLEKEFKAWKWCYMY